MTRKPRRAAGTQAALYASRSAAARAHLERVAAERTETKVNAREKAVERLAAMLRAESVQGPAHSPLNTIMTGLSLLERDPESTRLGYQQRAELLLCSLGLVAVDPALVEAVEKAVRLDAAARAAEEAASPEKLAKMRHDRAQEADAAASRACEDAVEARTNLDRLWGEALDSVIAQLSSGSDGEGER